ncbi:MAG TPA: Ig-like domain-containing protein, partial [Candidatus Nanopelagicales bacterium]|nr:Ig-like domain-containing protein [Candidatus Nanopelagicales bacterium]
RPVVTFVEKGLASGSQHSWTVDAIETNGTQASAKSPSTGTVRISAATAYQTAVDADSPSFFWKLGEPAGPVAVDASAGGSSGAYSGTLTYGQAGPIPGDATGVTTNGVDGIVVSNPVSGPSTYSVEAWFKTTSTTGGKIVGFGNRAAGLDFSGNPAVSSNYDKHVYMTNDGRIVFGVYNGGFDTLYSPTALNDGQWHHVVATQGAAGMALYVDATRVGRNGVTTNQAYDGYWRVGGDNLGAWPDQPSSNFFAGTIADVAVYPTAITTTQVRAHWTASGRVAPPIVTPSDAYGQAVYADEPLQYWRLDETSGTTLADASNNGATGLVQGSATLGVPGALGATGKAVSLDGSSYLTSASATSSPTAFSLEMWFSTTTTTGGKLIGFGSNQTGDSGAYDKHVYLTDDGHLVFGVWNGQSDIVTSTKTLNDGQWHQVVATQGPSGMALYIDGSLDATNGVTTNQGYDGYWRVGGDNLGGWPGQPSTSYVTAKVDEVSIYGGALSASRVAAHYAASGNSTPDTQNPTVAVTAPADGATVSGATTISANASDDKAVAQVEFFVDGSSVGVDTSAPYSVSWNASAPGPHSITAVATDTAAKTTTSTPVSVTVPAPDTTDPTVSITSPAAGSIPFGATTINATASDNKGVAKVEFFVDGTSVGVDTTAPYSASWNAIVTGSHTLTAVATDTSNNTGSATPVVVTVQADGTPPSAPGTLTGSAGGQTSVNLQWGAATDNSGTVAGYVVTRNGTALQGLVSGTSFTDTGLTAGTDYTYTVAAKDPTGNVGPSSNSVLVTTTPAGPTTLFSYNWSVADGTPWPAQFTTVVGNGTITTLSGAGVLTVNDVASANARAVVSGVAARTDLDVTFSYAWSSTSAKAYFDVWTRGSGAWVGTYRPRDGYGVELSSNSGTVAVLKSVAGTQSTIRSLTGANKLVTTKQWLRIRVVGTTLQVKIWADGSPEPAAWTSTDTDSSVTAGGQVFLALNRASTNVGAKSVTIDDLVVNAGA